MCCHKQCALLQDFFCTPTTVDSVSGHAAAHWQLQVSWRNAAKNLPWLHIEPAFFHRRREHSRNEVGLKMTNLISEQDSVAAPHQHACLTAAATANVDGPLNTPDNKISPCLDRLVKLLDACNMFAVHDEASSIAQA